LATLGLKREGYVLATIHRAENTDDCARLKTILNGLKLIAEEIPVVFPTHPRTRRRIAEIGLEQACAPVQIIDAVGYLDMVMLERNAALVATDSGGVQKEAYFYRVPCMTLRYETEWVELVELGWNRVVAPIDPAVILHEARRSIGTKGRESKLYGDGNAGGQTVSVLRAWDRSLATSRT
jgi:UDP-GlcNAc3NAcA epimerase